jgi:RNA polymerase subunit RPABC4/transcription elongation factor Spt4
MSESLFSRPPVHPIVECPNCKQLIEYGFKNCPKCREEIGEEYAARSAAVVYHNTQACSVANSITAFAFWLALLGVQVLLLIFTSRNWST